MSILRPEKRDPNYIRNKSDIGLSKVDIVSSAEFASIVLDQVRRYLNRETIYQTLGRRFIALAKISCKDDGSGNLVKILSGNLFITFAVLNESEEIREAVKLETIYTHYMGKAETGETEVDYSDDVAKVEYNIFKADARDLSTLLNECQRNQSRMRRSGGLCDRWNRPGNTPYPAKRPEQKPQKQGISLQLPNADLQPIQQSDAKPV